MHCNATFDLGPKPPRFSSLNEARKGSTRPQVPILSGQPNKMAMVFVRLSASSGFATTAKDSGLTKAALFWKALHLYFVAFGQNHALAGVVSL